MYYYEVDGGQNYPNGQPSDTSANRFFNQGYDHAYSAVTDSCFEVPANGNYSSQDFKQCSTQPCQASGGGGGSSCPNPVGDPPYCGGSDVPQWDTNSCSWACVSNPNSGSPILIDVSGGGFQLTSAAGGVSYDISGNGVPVQIAWTAAGVQNAFLCLPDAYGSCNTGKQLFGNFTPQPKSSAPNGFAALAMYDTPASGGNGDGVIDARDAIFSSLRLWIDANHDGIGQPNELYTLPALGVNSISLNYKLNQRTDQYGNQFRYFAQVNPGGATGTGRLAYDVFLVTQTNTTAAKACPVPKPKVLAKPSGK